MQIETDIGHEVTRDWGPGTSERCRLIPPVCVGFVARGNACHAAATEASQSREPKLVPSPWSLVTSMLLSSLARTVRELGVSADRARLLGEVPRFVRDLHSWRR